MKNRLTEVAYALASLNQSAATGPVMLAWENSDGRTVMAPLSRHLVQQALSAYEALQAGQEPVGQQDAINLRDRTLFRIASELRACPNVTLNAESMHQSWANQIEAALAIAAPDKDAEIAALRLDAERLDWLDNHVVCVQQLLIDADVVKRAATLREAIDNAKAQAQAVQPKG